MERFLDKDLLPTLRTTLEEFQPAGMADKQKELADAISMHEIDPDSLEAVRQLKATLTEDGDLDRLEKQMYSDLYTVKAVIDNQKLDSRQSTGAIYSEGLNDLINSNGQGAGQLCRKSLGDTVAGRQALAADAPSDQDASA